MSFEGYWDVTIATPIGKQQVRLRIAERDGQVSGTATQGAETVALLDPMLDGDRLRWSQSVTRPMKLSIRFDVTRAGDTLTGTAKPGILPTLKVVGRRAPRPPLDHPSATAEAVAMADETSPTPYPTIAAGPDYTGKPRLQVGMLVFPGLTLLDLIGPQTVLHGPAVTHLIGKTRELMLSDTGVPIQPKMTFDDAPADLDVLFVPGGPGQIDVMRDEETLAFLADRGSRARYVTAVCTGSLMLGAAGLLQGYKATSHWAARGLLELFGAEPVDARVVIDRNRITGGGVTAGIDFGLTLLNELYGEETAKVTQLLMEYDPAPPFDAGSPRRAGEKLVADAFAILAPVAEMTMTAIERRRVAVSGRDR